MNDTPVVVHTDGAAQGNPGPAGIGYLIEEESGQILASVSEYIGETTNNVAEYRALIAALKHVRELGFQRVRVLSDSLLMVQQMNGAWSVKHAGLAPLRAEATTLLADFKESAIAYVPREENRDADRLATRAITAAKPKKHRSRPTVGRKTATIPPSLSAEET
jgi:ribonuclease HI